MKHVMHPAIAGELAAAAIADVEGTGLPLQDRVAAAIMAAVEMEADEHGIISRRPPGAIDVRVDPRLGPAEWRLEQRASVVRAGAGVPIGVIPRAPQLFVSPKKR